MKSLNRSIALSIFAVAGLVVHACTQNPVNPRFDRSYTVIRAKGLPLPALLSASPYGSSTLKEQHLTLARDGTYRITYTLILRTGESTVERRTIENGTYRLEGTRLLFEDSISHPELESLATDFSILKGGMNIEPSIGPYWEVEYAHST